MPDLQDAAIQAAESLQSAHINRSPSVHRDLAPATAAEKRVPVVFDSSSADAVSDVEDDEVPLSILKPLPSERKPRHLQLPDLRFEQSYLKSISEAGDWRMVAYITVKDQILMPLVQGIAMTLIVAWWRHWNTAAKFGGQSMGAKIRRWWWGINNWKTPANMPRSLRDKKFAGEVADYYSGPANAGSD